jgi:hypothetical protein
MDTVNILILGIFILLLWLALRVVPRIFTRRAAIEVIRILRAHEATDVYSAKHAGDLGLNPPGMLDRLMKARDYKPMALSILTRAGVIQQTRDGRLYLSESGLREYCQKDTENRLGICG